MPDPTETTQRRLRLAVITECELSRRHGTGAQILRTLSGMPVDYFHFYFACWHGTISEITQSKKLASYDLPIPKVRRLWQEVRNNTVGPWYRGTEINSPRMRGWLERKQLQFDVAYVVVACEEGAAKAASLLAVLGCPYVLHVVDLFHAQGVDPAGMPGFHELLAGASSVLALTPAIQYELERFEACKVEQIFEAQSITPHTASAPAEAQPLRIIMGGRPYAGGCNFLAAALRQTATTGRQIEIVNVGPYFNDLPESLRPFVTNAGFIDNDEEYRRTLAGAHLGFLSGPSQMDHYGKYSFPSRCTEYMMAGLPVVGYVPQESATALLLSPITPQAFRRAASIEYWTAAIQAFAGTQAAWNRASAAARAFAIERFSIDTKRAILQRKFASACLGASPAARQSTAASA